MKKRRLILISIFLLAILFSTQVKGNTNQTKDIYIDYTVRRGDTLWEIAKENKASNTDTREYIYEIKQLNNLQTSSICEGQTIKIIKNERHNGNCNPSTR